MELKHSKSNSQTLKSKKKLLWIFKGMSRNLFGMLDRMDSVISADYETAVDCGTLENEEDCNIDSRQQHQNSKETRIQMEMEMETIKDSSKTTNTEENPDDTTDGRTVRKRAHNCGENNNNNWAEHKNVAEGLMDIALLSANANQLRFLITYNSTASTYYISLGLIALSLILQVAVGIALIFKRRMKNTRKNRTRTRINEFLISGVFMVTVVNVLLAAFTTTDGQNT